MKNSPTYPKENPFPNSAGLKKSKPTISTDVIEKGLDILSRHPEIIESVFNSKISMPNIPTMTNGGKVMWYTMCESNGLRLQQNTFTQHARILDSENRRIAWGTLNAMKEKLQEISELKDI